MPLSDFKMSNIGSNNLYIFRIKKTFLLRNVTPAPTSVVEEALCGSLMAEESKRMRLIPHIWSYIGWRGQITQKWYNCFRPCDELLIFASTN